MRDFPIDKLDFSKGGVNLYFYIDDILDHRVCAKSREHFEELTSYDYQGTIKLVLECSTKGDKRFSAFGAKVKVFKATDFIEFHYFLSKQFNGLVSPNSSVSWDDKMDFVRKVKNKTPDSMCINEKQYNVDLLPQWYDLLWCKYLDANHKLVEYLNLFDDYNDIFKGKSASCQADSIRKYIKEGRGKVMEDCKELLTKMKESN